MNHFLKAILFLLLSSSFLMTPASAEINRSDAHQWLQGVWGEVAEERQDTLF